jgi:hypothetical protein
MHVRPLIRVESAHMHSVPRHARCDIYLNTAAAAHASLYTANTMIAMKTRQTAVHFGLIVVTLPTCSVMSLGMRARLEFARMRMFAYMSVLEQNCASMRTRF